MELKGKVSIFGKYDDQEQHVYIGDDNLADILEDLEGKEVEITIKEVGSKK